MIDFKKLSYIEKSLIKQIREGKALFHRNSENKSRIKALDKLIKKEIIELVRVDTSVYETKDAQIFFSEFERYKLKDVFCILEIPIDHPLIENLIKDENVMDITALVVGGFR